MAFRYAKTVYAVLLRGESWLHHLTWRLPWILLSHVGRFILGRNLLLLSSLFILWEFDATYLSTYLLLESSNTFHHKVGESQLVPTYLTALLLLLKPMDIIIIVKHLLWFRFASQNIYKYIGPIRIDIDVAASFEKTENWNCGDFNVRLGHKTIYL